eukprot:jgi/Psemu1/255190/estExt_Genewise1Plus.C_1290055
MRPPTDIVSLARFILSPECQSIVVLTGAGVSVASGIPDFRSPGGMYDTLRPELLTAEPWEQELMERDPTNVVNWDIFQHNSFPYLEVRRPFILGTRNKKWKATIAHRFIELLHLKTNNKLTRIYTQNIDGLQGQCKGLPSEKIVNVHGTISEAQCEACGTSIDFNIFCDQPILCTNCGKAQVKPKTVLFGRNLPKEFFVHSEEDLQNCDLLVVAGTSLVVSPANSLVYRVPKETIRVVVNNERVGEELGIDYGPNPARDYFQKGESDEIFLDLIQELGWLDDLTTYLDDLPPGSAEMIKSRYK